MNARSAFAALSLLLAGQASPPGPVSTPRNVAILCDPASSRLSVRSGVEAQIPDPQYPVRRLVKVDDLIVHFRGDGGEGQYQGGLGRFERCGLFMILLEG